jgi:hypothetical protein
MLLPAAGLALAVFAGWIVPQDSLAVELGLGPRAMAALKWILRYDT